MSTRLSASGKVQEDERVWRKVIGWMFDLYHGLQDEAEPDAEAYDCLLWCIAGHLRELISGANTSGWYVRRWRGRCAKLFFGKANYVHNPLHGSFNAAALFSIPHDSHKPVGAYLKQNDILTWYKRFQSCWGLEFYLMKAFTMESSQLMRYLSVLLPL